MDATHTTPLRERMRQELQTGDVDAPVEPSPAALRPLPPNRYPTDPRRLPRAS